MLTLTFTSFLIYLFKAIVVGIIFGAGYLARSLKLEDSHHETWADGYRTGYLNGAEAAKLQAFEQVFEE